MKQLDIRPVAENTPQVAAFVEETLEALDCPMKVMTSMSIALDELYSNIVRHSGAGRATVACGVEDGQAVLRLIDDGAPYDPTLREPPDVSLSAEKREIGGLGIHLVRRLMDSVEYRYEDGRNVLTIRKRLP